MTGQNLDEIRERLLCKESVQQMIRVRAYEIYQMRGAYPEGAAQDWFQAEGEVLAFLIVDESSREDEKEAEKPVGAASLSNIQREAPAPKQHEPRPESNARRAATKASAVKRTTSKKSAKSKDKLKRARKQLEREESAH